MKTSIIAAAAAFAFGLTGATAFADDISFDELPDQVRQTVERETAGARLGDVERDDNGQTVYEIEFYEDGQKYELDVSEDGEVLRRHPD